MRGLRDWGAVQPSAIRDEADANRRIRGESNGIAAAGCAASRLRFAGGLAFIFWLRGIAGLFLFLILVARGSIVGRVEAASLEDHSRSRPEQAPDLSAAHRAPLPRRFGDALEELEAVTALQ